MIGYGSAARHRLYAYGGADDPNASRANLSSLKYYLPASSAGAPPISPAFHSTWNVTAGAARVVGRLHRKYGTTYETVTFTPSTTQRVLVRQYVIPLNEIPDLGALLPYSWSGILTRELATLQVRTSNINANVWGAARIVDSGGSNITQTTFASGGTSFTVGITAGSVLVTSSGNFLSSDVNRSIFLPGELSSNFIVEYLSANTVVVQYPPTSTTSGSATLYRTRGCVPTLGGGGGIYSPGAFMAVAGYDAGNTDSYGYLYGGRLNPTWYWVIELGLNSTTVGTQVVDFKFGDPSDHILPEDYTNLGYSSGSYLYYSSISPIIF